MARWCIRPGAGVHSKAVVLLLVLLLAFCIAVPLSLWHCVRIFLGPGMGPICEQRWQWWAKWTSETNTFWRTARHCWLAGWRGCLVSIGQRLNGRSPEHIALCRILLWSVRCSLLGIGYLLDVDIQTIFEERLQQLMAPYNGSHFSKLVWSRSLSSTVFQAICVRLDNWCYLVKCQRIGACLTDDQQFWS